MKQSLAKRLLSTSVAIIAAMQCMAATVSVSAADMVSVYKKTDAYSSCKGEQGKDGWYFMYKDSKGAYIDMTWTDNKFKGIGGESVDEHFIVPGYDAPTVVGWEAPYTGTVTLTAQDNTVYRDGPNPTGENVIATMKLNNEILTDDNNQKTQWVFDNTCKSGIGNQSYTVTNLHINKGDMIYHEVDCGTNNTGAGIYWKPVITYTEIEQEFDPTRKEYKKTDAYTNSNGLQGHDGWYFMYKDSKGAYIDMTWTDNHFKGLDGGNINEHFIVPGYDTPTVVGWKAPYTGTVTLTAQDNTVYRDGPNPTGENVIATMKLNNEILTDDNNQKTQWVFDNTCKNGIGNQSYTVTNLHINKGDMIYHEVDCGTNNTGAGIYWKPVITYTEIEQEFDPTRKEYKKTDAYTNSNGLQGYDGWYYLKKDKASGEYTQIAWNETDKIYGSWGGSYVNEHFVMGDVNATTSIAWKAPFSGTVTLRATHNIVYRENPSKDQNGSDITAAIRINDEQLKQNDETDAKWTFTNQQNNENGFQAYVIEGIHVNKGDIIYHEVDCGGNRTAAQVYWKPIVEYTAFDPEETEQKIYFINTITDYKNYADIVNSTDSSACAKLMADIEWNRNTPQLMNFAGTIDGNNHKITLRGNSMIESAIDGAVIKNLIIDGAVKMESNAAALISNTAGDTGTVTIEKCMNLADVEATGDYAAGFVANGVDGVMVNINNSYSNAIVKSAGENADPLANKQSTFTNCWYLKNGTKKGEEFVNPTVSMAASAEQFASGAVAYGLNAAASDFIFTQKIGTDLNPVVASENSAKVYRTDTDEYSNNDGAFIAKNGNSTMVCSSKDAQLIFAQYKNDEMTVVDMQSITAGEIIRSDITYNQDTDYYRIFVWENFDNIVPICPHFEYAIQ